MLMRAQLRIVSGSLRGRKLTCVVHPGLRPTPDRVREALFSILGNAVPDRPFVDVFAGTGVVGMEALSRGAGTVTFVERDFRLVHGIEENLAHFQVADRARIARADVYRWVDRFGAPAEPVNVFLSPPFADLERRPDDLLRVVAELQGKLPPGSLLVVQSETHVPLEPLPGGAWERRRYGRNELLIWVKEEPGTAAEAPPAD
jgi:16S rRNA (guanine(966)-N(2))-methyltransferase RsmD